MPKKILIIEDDPDILDMMAIILRDEGYEVVTALNCGLLDNVASLNPDLILLDNRLYEELGADACRQFKSNPDTVSIPVIIVSANLYLERLSKISLADGFIAKPFDIDELIAVVKKNTVASKLSQRQTEIKC